MLQVGDPCTADSQCPSVGNGSASCMKDWPGGGFCTMVGCGAECPGNAWCTPDKSYEHYYCAPLCDPFATGGCRTGYICATTGGCLPPAIAGEDAGS